MTEQIVQNNYKIIADLNNFSSDFCELNDFIKIKARISDLRHYISKYRYLNEEFERKCNSYKNTLLGTLGKSYIDKLNTTVISEITNTIVHEPESLHEYNDKNNFYFPGFIAIKSGLYIGEGLSDFYENHEPNRWLKVLTQTGSEVAIKTLLEDFGFYFISLQKINVKLYEGKNDIRHVGKYNFKEYNFGYIYSIINGVLNYFQKLILNNPNVDYTVQSISSTGKIPKTGKPLDKELSNVYLEILYLLRKGIKQKDLAEKTGYASKTIENYLRNIRAILKAKTSVEAIANFIEDYGSIEFYVSDDLTQK